MQPPAELPLSTVLTVLSAVVLFGLGYAFSRWQTRHRWKALVHRAQHAWDDWTDDDVHQELNAYKAFDPKMLEHDAKPATVETYRTAIGTSVEIGGYTVILHPGDVFRVERIRSSKGKPTGGPSAMYGKAAALFEALSGQAPETALNYDSPLNYTIAARCLTCKQPTPLELHPIDGVTAYELVQPKGWRVVVENRRPRAAFFLQCPECRKDILHEHKPDA